MVRKKVVKKKKVVKRKKAVSKKKEVMENKSDGEYICPKCKSKNVAKVFSLGTLFGIFPRWRCKSCGLEEMIFPRVVKK